MALSKASSDEDRTRFFRLSLIILDELTPILRDLLHNEICPSHILNRVLQQKPKQIQPVQLPLIHKAKTEGYKKFDITLLCTLLCNCCPNIQQPTQSWKMTQMPAQNEITIGDDIVRIRVIKNNYVSHIHETAISETEFKDLWSIIFDICTRMQSRLPNKHYVQRLQEAQYRTIDSATEEIFMEKIKELADEDENNFKKILSFIEEKALTSAEKITIEPKRAEKGKLVETLTDISICILNEMVDAIHGLTPESEIEQLYELVEAFIRKNKENIENNNLQDFLQGLKEKIKRHAKQQEGNRMKILARFAKFILGIEKYYDGFVESSKGSLILTVTFSSQKGYDLYKRDLQRGIIGQQILELILYPPYLASFDLQAEDLVVCLNGQKLTQDSGDNDPSINIKSPNLEACADHPDQFYMMACQQCQLPVCVQCMESSEHKDHDFNDLAVSLRVKMAEFNEKLHQGLLVKHNLWTTKEKLGSEVNEIQLRMIEKYQALQRLLDEALKQNLKDVNRYRETQINNIEKKLNDTDQFISDSMNNLKEIYENLPAQAMLQLKSCSLKADSFESSNIIYPEFIENEPDLMNINDLFGKLKIPQMTAWESGIELDEEEESDDGDSDVEDVKIPTVTLEGSFNLTSTSSHVSQLSSNKAWVSNFYGDLYLLNDTGFELHHLKTLSGGSGSHTVTKEEALIYINPEKVIMKISKDLKEDNLDIYIPPSMSPCCIYSSQFNSDLLIGLLDKNNKNQGALLRISGSMEDSTWLQYVNESEPLYEYPQYITENINQDVIVCDSSKGALIATDVRGKFRFRYTGYLENSEFDPNGISTDSYGQILVCDQVTNSIQVIDKKGKFLYLLLINSDGIDKPFCLNLTHDTMWVGTKANSLMLVYKVEYEEENQTMILRYTI